MRIAGRRAQGLFSQVTYCGGYSGEVPPLPIPNREVKLTHADGTDPPVGRVGSRRSSEALSSARLAGLLCLLCRTAAALVRCCAAARFPLRSHPPTFSPLRCDASLVSVAPFPLRCDASEQGSSLREIRSEPCPSAFSAARLIIPFQLLFLSALPAPLRRFGRGPRSQKKFARDPLPPLYSAALVSFSVFPAPLRRFGTGFIPQRNSV